MTPVTTAAAPPAGFTPSPNIADMRESATLAVSARAKALRAAGRQIIDLGTGEPDFDTPEFIRFAAQRAIDAGATRYTATEGILPLREAIAARATRDGAGAAPVAAGEVVVSTGSKQSLFNACFTLFGPGDEVLVPTPGWTSYYEMIGLSRATAVPVHGSAANGFKVTASALDRAATSRTRGLIINSPCNPTGAVYDADELGGILDLAAENGWWVISDEIYRHICYAGVAPSVLAVAQARDRLVVVDGVAKAYAMTGWRIGWAIAPRPVAAAIAALQSHVTSNAAAVSQHAALAALTMHEPAEDAIAKMVEEFRRRRNAAFVHLHDRVPAIYPEGAFYIFLDVGACSTGADPGAAFAAHLLDNHDVAVVPGSAFLEAGWIRMSYAAPIEQVVQGAQRIVMAHDALRQRVR
ncbi:MAG: pyridoxal phosphate-dependent aminotransferase [Gemmatimonadota bacterium]|nr:pyridoxal phosphate-dependent aminotransferase [Gemmatimonadota bacterium]